MTPRGSSPRESGEFCHPAVANPFSCEPAMKGGNIPRQVDPSLEIGGCRAPTQRTIASAGINDAAAPSALDRVARVSSGEASVIFQGLLSRGIHDVHPSRAALTCPCDPAEYLRELEKPFRARSFHVEEKFREDAFDCALMPALYEDLFVGTRRDSNRIRLNFPPSRLDPFLSTAKSRIVGGRRLVDFNVFDFAPNKDSLMASRFSEIRLRNDLDALYAN